MPIVPRNDSIFANLPSSVTIRLPDAQKMWDDTQRAGFMPSVQGQVALVQSQVWQVSSQLSLAHVVQNVGVPVRSIFDTLLDAFEIDVLAEVDDALKDAFSTISSAVNKMKGTDGGEALSMAMETGVGLAVNTSAIMPIVGWVIKIVWNVAKAIVRIVRMVRRQKRAADALIVYRKTRFDPELDNIVLNDVVTALRTTKDWSRLFGPPSLGKGPGTAADFARAKIEGGWEIVRRDLAEWSQFEPGATGWMGIVAGTPWLHRGIQVLGNVVRDIGQVVVPSTSQVGVWLWQHIMGRGGTAGPSMYCINAQLVKWWGAYIHDLHVYLYESADYLTDAQKTAIMRKFNHATKAFNDTAIFNWGTSTKPKEGEQENYTPVREAEILYKRQLAFLDTLNCAYVDDSYIALKTDMVLRDRWDQRRRDLLQHPARCDVDLTNVPDTEYRNALIGSGAQTPQCLAAQTLAARAPAEPKRVASLPDGQLPDPAAPAVRRLPPVVPFVALGGAAFYAWKKGLFKGLRLPRVKV